MSAIHRVRTEAAPATAALEYEQALREAFSTPLGPPVTAPGSCFDFVLLGLGADGHTASWFPGGPAVAEPVRWALAVQSGGRPSWRVTLTPPVINAAAEVAILVSGPEKAEALAQVLEGPFQPEALPAQAVAPRNGELRWLVDNLAAVRLTRKPPAAY